MIKPPQSSTDATSTNRRLARIGQRSAGAGFGIGARIATWGVRVRVCMLEK